MPDSTPDASPTTDGLSALLDELVAGRGRTGWRPIDAHDLTQLTSAEAAIVGSAVAKRRAEFATGRRLLRELLQDDGEILRAASGAPLLPPHVVATLSHDSDVAVGIAAPSGSFQAVGIDCEPLTDLDHGVAAIVVRGDDSVPDPLTAFVAKEAAYKAWSSLGGELLEHQDVHVAVDGRQYQATMAGGLMLHGQIGQTSSRMVACVFVPAD